MSTGGRIRGLDGLRALGCALVLVYHLWPSWAPGGNIGVDVFFVVSGFLITTLLVREIGRTGSVDVVAFVGRRLRRLAPAVVVCALAVTALAAWVGGDVLVGIGRQLAGTLTFTANWVQVAGGQSYFDQQTPALLTHAWSLGVEQQFYLLWPFLLLLLWRAPQRVRPWLALAVGATSLALAAVLGGSRAYLGTDTHLYGLMLGAALALALVPRRPDPQALWYPPGWGPTPSATLAGVRGAAGWVALVVLVPLAVLVPASSELATPWLLLAASVLTVTVVQALTPAVLAAAPGRSLVRVLELRPVVWTGERSYSIYLWHWPLLVLAHAQWPPADERLVALGVMAATLLAAEASHRWVETPFRRHGVAGVLRVLRRRAVTLGVPAAMASVLVLGSTVWAVERAPARTEAEELFASGIGEGGVTTYPRGDDPGSGESPSGEAPSQEGDADEDRPDDERPDDEQTDEDRPEEEATPAGEPVPGEDVSVVGDSVTLASGPAIGEALPGVTVDAETSRFFPAEVDIVERMAVEGTLRGHVVLAGATNGEIAPHQLDRLLAATGDRCVVLVTGHAPPSATWVPDANERIREAAEAHERVVVADWHAVAEGSPELLASDGIHPGTEGAQLYAGTVDEALRSCP